MRLAAQQALDYAAGPGVEAEIYGVYQRALKIEVAQQQVETLKDAREKGLGIRVIKNGRLGFAYTTALEAGAIKAAVRAALKASTYMSADEHLNLTPAGAIYPQLQTFDDLIEQHSLEDKIALAQKLEALAIETDQRIKIVERSGYEQSMYQISILNSLGLDVSGQGNYCSLYQYVVAEQDDDAQGGFASKSCRNYRDLSPEEVADRATHRALRSLKARSLASQELPCILKPYVAVKFLGLLGQMLDAEAVLKGKSLLAGKIGQAIAAREFTVMDDGTLKGGLGSFPFDDEGVPAQQNTLIKDGVLQGFLYDNYNARKAGLRSSGNAVRMSFRNLPKVGPSNLLIKAGDQDEAALLEPIAKGLYITNIMGMHTANPVSGDFSLGASGIVIEQGELTYPVRGLLIAGNMTELLQDIDALGNELRFFGSRAAPSLRVAALSVAGS